ncbi:MAG: hypothetical protein ABEJ76_05315 [Halanaeroarchaeum sp.]
MPGKLDHLNRRQFAKVTGGLVGTGLLAGCSGSGGGCGNPNSEAKPRSLLPNEGGGFEKQQVSSESLQEDGEARIKGLYSDSYSSYAAIVIRFANNGAANNYESHLLSAAKYKNEVVYVVMALQNFVFSGWSQGGGSTGKTLEHVRELLARSPVLTVDCISEHNVISEDLLPDGDT